MDASVQTESTSATPASRGIFGTGIPSSVSSVIAFLLFFLPFAELRCTSGSDDNFLVQNTGTAFSNSGMGLALGLQWKSSFSGFGNQMNMERNDQLRDREEPNYYALVAWILALATAIFCISKWKWGSSLASFTALLSLAALVGLYIDLKDEVKNVSHNGGGGAFESYTDVNMELVFTPWFYATALLLAATVWLAWKRKRS
jgi:hypothetical protein